MIIQRYYATEITSLLSACRTAYAFSSDRKSVTAFAKKQTSDNGRRVEVVSLKFNNNFSRGHEFVPEKRGKNSRYSGRPPRSTSKFTQLSCRLICLFLPSHYRYICTSYLGIKLSSRWICSSAKCKGASSHPLVRYLQSRIRKTTFHLSVCLMKLRRLFCSRLFYPCFPPSRLARSISRTGNTRGSFNSPRD